jgi:hypothetical protein
VLLESLNRIHQPWEWRSLTTLCARLFDIFTRVSRSSLSCKAWMSFGIPLSSNHRAGSEAPGLTYYAELDSAGEHLRRDRSINFMSAQGGPPS